MQVWTVGEGFGIGSEFLQACCAANNLRDHDLAGVKAILVPCAHRLLSESTRILCTLRNGRGGSESMEPTGVLRRRARLNPEPILPILRR
jgi:hypothetical protein